MAAAASSLLSRLFRQPHSGRRPPDPKPSLVATLNLKASSRRPNPNPKPNPSQDATLNSKISGGGGSTNTTSKASSVTRRLSRAAVSIISEPDLDLVVAAFKEHSSSSRFRQTGRIFDLVVRRLAAAGRRDGVAEILEAQKAYPGAFSSEGFAARIISLYGTAGMPDHAVATFRELPSLGCPPSIKCLNALLLALVDSGEPAMAIEVLREDRLGVVPTATTYNVLAHAAIKLGDLDSALAVLRKLQEEKLGPPTVAFNTILNGLCKAGRLDDAEKLWASMGEQGVEPDVRTFNARLRCLVALGKIQEAVDLLGEMAGNGTQPDGYSYSALIAAYCKSGDLHEAKKVFEEMSKRGCSANQWTYMALVPSLCEAGELDLAIEQCKASMENQCCVTVEVLVRVTDALVASGRLAEARKLLKEARSRNYYINNLDTLAKAEERAAEVIHSNSEVGVCSPDCPAQ